MTLDGGLHTNNTINAAGWESQINTIKSQCGCSKPKQVDLNAEIGKLLTAAGELLQNVAGLLEKLNCKPPSSCQPAPCQPPRPENSCHPGGLKKDDKGAITTPGGYKIEQIGQFEWKITGPDCKTTRVWGDPHVDEGDGGKWDFKRDSTFVLGDGTRINVTTAPWGSNMTVTKQLEIISGNDRILVSDIDKGKGKVGEITKDGFANVNSFGKKDVFVMGKETDDWSFTGKEIVGSNNGGESFKLGNALEPLVSHVNSFGGGNQWAASISNGMPQIAIGEPNGPDGGIRARDKQTNKALAKALTAIGEMFNALSKILALSSRISQGKLNQVFTA